MKIGIDIMGGDYAPNKTVEVAILANENLPNNIKLVLFGNIDVIESELKKFNYDKNRFEIINCSEVIKMDEHPTKAIREKKDSSISKGFDFLAKNKIDGFCSAGNTGAMFVGGFYALKTITGVLRPPLCTLLPREDGKSTVLLDVGANADCKADVLYQFGLLGSLYSKYVCGVKNPKVKLLNLGEEKNKGNMLTQSTYVLMENNPDFNFQGNCEGRDIFSEDIDVIVCDGFTGNIVIKQAEAVYSIMKKRDTLDDFFSRLNYEDYGGTPILGLSKPVIIGHGISNEIAIENMIYLTKDIIKSDLTYKIKNNFSQ